MSSHCRRPALQANQQKLRLETKQRAARKAAESGEAMRPRWFKPLGTTMGEGIAYVSARTATCRCPAHRTSPCKDVLQSARSGHGTCHASHPSAQRPWLLVCQFQRAPSLQEYHGGYWESRSSRQWEGCRDIFGE